ncbi:MAG: YhbY family RNA-binding protein [Candidatus Altiarchaeales archaeon]|nr:YhbY family RNA-binding protein [Candidatus Altiarchaeota archaeon]MCG2781985.1 YhbY family RNA-binding protein [Candidatus Altiarchaeales archaeon]MBU4266962.1 YhbY family RNA-binding protein [Candidatus Altiarchaeota archaeon]MBU4341600.1 YhbY family RNA-binding protein [Candidatus Altiarchaeota archaeon]MBU4406755.1 YhbY family RNA-binding protein [Candidatus Altiarchaeota archaeon]
MSKDSIQVGKNGITDNLIAEIKEQLKKKKALKVKILKAARTEKSRKEIAAEVAQRTRSRLLQLRGNVFILSTKMTLEEWKKSSKK